MVGRQERFKIGHTLFPYEDMGQLVGYGEHLSCGVVGVVDENQRCIFVDQGEASEFVWIQFPMCVIAYDSR